MNLVASTLSATDLSYDQLLGSHVYATAKSHWQDLLFEDEKRYYEGRPSGLKIYWTLTKLIHNVTQKRTDKLINELADSSGSGRWQGVSFPAQLHEQLLELDQAVRSIGITCCDDAERLDSTWKSTINRMIAPLETDLRYMPEFGFKVMKFKGEREDEGRKISAFRVGVVCTAQFLHIGFKI